MKRTRVLLGVLFIWGTLYMCFQNISIYEINGNSMSPAFQQGDYVLCIPYSTLEVGDIVIADTVLGTIVKRVASISSAVEVEGITYEVPAGYVFLLGDNPQESLDSRNEVLGAIPISNIRCVVTGRVNKILLMILQVLNIK